MPTLGENIPVSVVYTAAGEPKTDFSTPPALITVTAPNRSEITGDDFIALAETLASGVKSYDLVLPSSITAEHGAGSYDFYFHCEDAAADYQDVRVVVEVVPALDAEAVAVEVWSPARDAALKSLIIHNPDGDALVLESETGKDLAAAETDAIKIVTDAIATMLYAEDTHYQFTEAALANAPAGADEESVEAIAAASAKAVWNKPESEINVIGSIGKWLRDMLAGIRTGTDKIGAGALLVQSTIDEKGNVNLYRGKTVSLRFNSETPRDLTGENVSVKFEYHNRQFSASVSGEAGAWVIDVQVALPADAELGPYDGELAVYTGEVEREAIHKDPLQVVVWKNPGSD